jgi:hypothetical protein
MVHWWRKTSITYQLISSGTSGYLSRTTDISQPSWIASLMGFRATVVRDNRFEVNDLESM